MLVRRLMVAAIFTKKTWLLLMWAVFGFLYLTRFWLFLLGLPYYYQQLLDICVDEVCEYEILVPASLPALEALGISIQSYAAYMTGLLAFTSVVSALVGLFVAWIRRWEWIALFVALVISPTAIRFVEIPGLPESLSALHNFYTEFLDGALFILFFLVFPDGRFVPRIAGWIFLVIYIPLYFYPPAVDSGLAWLVVLLSAIGCLVYRFFRRSNPVQRQQIKWLVLSLVVLLILYLPLILYGEIFRLDIVPGSLLFFVDRTLNAFTTLVIPVGIAIAITRYHLWDIDVIIRRTLIYTTLTAALALVYAGSVVVLQDVFQSMTGSTKPSQLAIVVSTLAVAALFSPLRKRVQERIDRRFYRRKYDAEQILATFSETARRETDLEALTDQLLEAAQSSLQPETISVWLKGAGKQKIG